MSYGYTSVPVTKIIVIDAPPTTLCLTRPGAWEQPWPIYIPTQPQ